MKHTACVLDALHGGANDAYQIAKRTGLSRGQVSVALYKLYTCGQIKIVGRRHYGAQRGPDFKVYEMVGK